VIDDYEDSNNPFSKIDNENNATRHQLNGYLYAEYIYGGRGANGKLNYQTAFNKAHKIYEESGYVDDRFDMKHIEVDLHLGKDEYVEQYSKSDTVRGMMKGLLYLIGSEVALTEVQRNKYREEVLLKAFKEISVDPYVVKGTNEPLETKQLERLFKIPSPFEYLKLDPDWKKAMGYIDTVTDPDGGVRDINGQVVTNIPDYEGIERENNPVRINLNHYLYAVYLFSGKGKVGREKVDEKFKKANQLYESSDEGMFNVDNTFQQTHLDQNFNLGPFYKQAETYTKFDNVKTVIASLYALTQENYGSFEKGTAAEQAQYKAYIQHLEEVFGELKEIPDENLQMQHLSKIKTFEELTQPKTVDSQVRMLSSMKTITEQNRFFLFGGPSRGGDVAKYIADPTLPQFKGKEGYIAGCAKGEIHAYFDGVKTESTNTIATKIDFIKKKNAALKTPAIPATEITAFEQRQKDLLAQFANLEEMKRENDLNVIAEKGYLKRLEAAQVAFYAFAQDLDYAIRDMDTPINTPPVAPPVGPAITQGPSVAPGSIDPYKENWNKGADVQSIFQNFVGTFTVVTGSGTMARVRDDQGNVIDKPLLNGTIVLRNTFDSKIPARRVENRVFVKVTYGAKKVWIPEDYLEIKDRAPLEKPPVTPPVKPPVRPGTKPTEGSEKLPEGETNSYYDVAFERVNSEVEKAPYRSSFIYIFNDQELSCTVEKAGGSYILGYYGNDVKPERLKYESMAELRYAVENRVIKRRLNIQQVQNKELWEKYGKEYRGNLSVGEPKNFEITGDHSMKVELDWEGSALADRNAQVEIFVQPDGSIFYRIFRYKIGYDAGRKHSGRVSGFNQLMQEIAHDRYWAENYRHNIRNHPEIREHEKLTRSILTRNNYGNRKDRIGEFYDVQSYRFHSYIRMSLNWTGNTSKIEDWHRQKANPTLEIRVNDANQIEYKLYNNLTGRYLGVYGTATDFNNLIDQVAFHRQNNGKSFNTPISSMPHWATDNLWPGNNEPIR
jgi:hypothetical protein